MHILHLFTARISRSPSSWILPDITSILSGNISNDTEVVSFKWNQWMFSASALMRTHLLLPVSMFLRRSACVKLCTDNTRRHGRTIRFLTVQKVTPLL